MDSCGYFYVADRTVHGSRIIPTKHEHGEFNVFQAGTSGERVDEFQRRRKKAPQP